MLYTIPGPVQVQHVGGSILKITIPTGEQFELVAESESLARVFASYADRLLIRYSRLRYGAASASVSVYSCDLI